MKKRVAIIGFGGMGQWHAAHIKGGYYQKEDVKESDVAELAGIYDIDPQKRKLASSEEINVYDSNEAIFNDDSVDIVTIAVPNDLHEPLAIAAMNAHKNVISEKPVTTSADSLKRMIDASDKNDVRFTVHQNRRFDPYFVGIKDIVKNGSIGDVISMESRVQGSNGVPGDWRKEREHGGGMLLDWGVHMIDQLLWMNGYDIDRVYCTFDKLTGHDVDDGCYVDIFLKSGIRLRTEVCTYNFITLPLMYVRGRTGTAMVNGWLDDIEIAKCTSWAQNDEILPVQTGAGLTKTMAPRDHRTVVHEKVAQPHTDIHDFYRNFCGAIDGKNEQLITHDQMLTVMKVIDAAFRSAETETVVKF